MSLIVISGCPRSGTSLTMSIFKDALGEDKMYGSKFPSLKHIEDSIQNTKDEEKKRYLEYVFETKDVDRNKKMVDMNPNGFWEDGRFSVKGLSYSANTRDIINEIKNTEDTKFCKIVTSGLLNTDPELISTIVYLIRDPYEVAKSQEKLTRNGTYVDDTGKTINIFEDMVVNTPVMFIESVIQWATFVTLNPDIPIVYLKHNDLLTKPKDALKSIYEELRSLGLVSHSRRKFNKASKQVDTSLYRSKVMEREPVGLWEEAYNVYHMLLGNNPFAVLQYVKNPKLQFNRQRNSWVCTRFRGTVSEATCKGCKAGGDFQRQLKDIGESRGAKWKEEPCAYDVAYDLDNSHISIEESTKNNFWNKS